MKKSILFLIVLFFISLSGFSQTKKIKHVILLGFDGFGAYAFDSANIPNMRKMMADGAYSLKGRSVLPSSSAVNWASMIMGASPTLHGYTEWDSKVPEIPSVTKDKWDMFPSIFGVLREQRPKAKTGVIYTWSGIGYLFEKEAVDYDLNTNNDSLTLVKSIEYIKNEKPTLLMIHFDQPDGVGHEIGHRTPAYYDTVHSIDKWAGKIRQAVKDAGIEENTLIILTADHGGKGKGHGGKSLDEVTIPWIAVGPGIKKNHEIKDVIITYDTAPTIAHALGIRTPQAWRGKPVLEAFK